MKYYKFLNVLLLVSILFGFTKISHADVNDGLVAYYPFNGNAKDESGNGKDGIVEGASLTSDKKGISDSAYRFDGIDDRISAPTIFEGDQDPFTLSAWLFIDKEVDSVNAPIFIECGHFDGAHRNSIWINSNRITFDQFYPGGGSASLEIDINNLHGKWFHVVVTKSQDLVSFFINTELMATVEHTETFSGNTPQITSFGALLNDQGWGYFFNGKIDEIRIYDRILFEDEINTLYNEECALMYQQGFEAGKKELNIAVAKAVAEATVHLINPDGKSVSDGTKILFTQEELNNEITNATKNLYTQMKVNEIISKILTWGDTNSDGKIGLEEAVKALLITSGVHPD